VAKLEDEFGPIRIDYLPPNWDRGTRYVFPAVLGPEDKLRRWLKKLEELDQSSQDVKEERLNACRLIVEETNSLDDWRSYLAAMKDFRHPAAKWYRRRTAVIEKCVQAREQDTPEAWRACWEKICKFANWYPNDADMFKEEVVHIEKKLAGGKTLTQGQGDAAELRAPSMAAFDRILAEANKRFAGDVSDWKNQRGQFDYSEDNGDDEE
jgi:hypothetical protein